MTAVWLQIIAGLAGLLSLWLRDYYSAAKKDARAKEAADEATQGGRRDLQDGNAGAVAARIDRVLAQDGSDAGGASGQALSGATSTDERLAAFGISVGEDPGSGRKM